MNIQSLLFGSSEKENGGIFSNIGPIHMLVFAFIFFHFQKNKNQEPLPSALNEGLMTPEFLFKTEILIDKMQIAGEVLKKSSKFIGPEKASFADLDNISEAVEAFALFQDLLPESIISEKASEQMTQINGMVNGLKKLYEINKIIDLKSLMKNLGSSTANGSSDSGDSSKGNDGFDLGQMMQMASLFSNLNNNNS